MDRPDVAAFTDSYRPTVNGVTYTVETWRDRWVARGGRMDVVYPDADYVPETGEYPVWSLPFPFYQGFRVGLPRLPDAVRDVDVVHAHTPFGVGLAGYRLARASDADFVASYHTPTSEYATYLAVTNGLEAPIERVARAYERRFLDRADVVVTPSERTATHVEDALGVTTPVTVVPNGVDVDFFEPVETAAFRDRHDLPEERPLVGYTGRHGYEKQLGDVVDAVERMSEDVTIVFGGDGPARGDLEARAREAGVDARFLGFVDRAELPALYASLDVFAFPSPVETQGLVALEANACGTPVVGVDSGALQTTVVDGETGYRYPAGDVDAFAAAIERALAEGATLRENCLERRAETSVEHAVDRLEDVYASI